MNCPIIIASPRPSKYNYSVNKTMREYLCDITRKMDEYLTPVSKAMNDELAGGFSTYILKPTRYNNEWQIPFRFPGATRGTLIVEEVKADETITLWKIIEVRFGEDQSFGPGIGCYKSELKENIQDVKGQYIYFHDPI